MVVAGVGGDDLRVVTGTLMLTACTGPLGGTVANGRLGAFDVGLRTAVMGPARCTSLPMTGCQCWTMTDGKLSPREDGSQRYDEDHHRAERQAPR